MRLFVAVSIDAAVARSIGECSDALRARALSQAPRARITWVPADRLHLTVRFIGEVDNDQAAVIATALQPRFTVSAFELVCEGTGAFPATGTPRVLWVGIASDLDPLRALEREVSERLDGSGMPREARPYRPHLTLARIRDAAGLRSGPLLEGFTSRRFGASAVDAITLFHSQMSPKGPNYLPVQQTKLRPA